MILFPHDSHLIRLASGKQPQAVAKAVHGALLEGGAGGWITTSMMMIIIIIMIIMVIMMGRWLEESKTNPCSGKTLRGWLGLELRCSGG